MRQNQETVILLHGFLRSGRNMRYMARCLQKCGYQCHRPSLPTTFHSLEYCTAVFERWFSEQRWDGRVHLVGHSMGGLVIRRFLSQNDVPGLGRVVLIGTPNAGSEIADVISRCYPWTLLALAPMRSLVSWADAIAVPLNRPPPDIGAIAGVRGYFLTRGLRHPVVNDGMVSMTSALACNPSDTVLLPYNHRKIHRTPVCAQVVDRFLRSSRFEMETTQQRLAMVPDA